MRDITVRRTATLCARVARDLSSCGGPAPLQIRFHHTGEKLWEHCSHLPIETLEIGFVLTEAASESLANSYCEARRTTTGVSRKPAMGSIFSTIACISVNESTCQRNSCDLHLPLAKVLLRVQFP